MTYRIISGDSHFVEPLTMWAERVEVYGADRMLWSSDYPHTDSPWPHSREYVEGGGFERISPEDPQKIVADNAARLYGLN